VGWVAGGGVAVGQPDGQLSEQPVAADVGPVGWMLVSSLGVQLAVPKGWPVVGAIAGCDPWPPAIVERGGGGVRGCGYTEPAGLTLVRIIRRDALADDPAAPVHKGVAATPQPLDRLPADLTVQPLADGRTQLTLTSDERDVAVVLRGPDVDLLQQVLATVEFVDVDAAGCPAVQASTPAWDRPGPAGDPVDVEGADSVSVCAYYRARATPAPRLAASALLDIDGGATLLDAIRPLAQVPSRTSPSPAAPGGWRSRPAWSCWSAGVRS
jgi:hypothetical protein